MISGKRGLAAAVLAALLFAPFAAASIPSAADLALAPRALPELAPPSIEATTDLESCGVFCQRLDVRLEAGLFGGGALDLLALDAWGNYRDSAELETSKNRFGFTGHLFDRETGTYYAKARYFDPGLGRFLSQDSYLGEIDSPPSLHRYAYGHNRPTYYVDPSGNAVGDPWYQRLNLVALGAVDAFTTNFNPAHTSIESSDPDVQAGQIAGHVLSIPAAAYEMAAGFTIAGGGTTGGAVAAVPSGGLSLAVATGSVAVGGGMVVHGGRAGIAAITNLASKVREYSGGSTAEGSSGTSATPRSPEGGAGATRGPDGPKPERLTPEGDRWRYERYVSEGGKRSFEDWKRISRGGRPGGPDHMADVAKNNAQATGDLRPIKVGKTVPDGVGGRGQVVEIRGQQIDPGSDGRVVVESEHFGTRGHLVSEGRDQLRSIREADPNATIVATDPARPGAPPLVYRPGTQPPTGRRLPPGTPTHERVPPR